MLKIWPHTSCVYSYFNNYDDSGKFFIFVPFSVYRLDLRLIYDILKVILFQKGQNVLKMFSSLHKIFACNW